MASVLIVPQTVINTGLLATFATPNVDGNFFLNEGRQILHVVNGGAVTLTVTIPSVALDSYGNVGHSLVYTVLAGEELISGYFSPRRFNDASEFVNITTSVQTGVEVAVLKVVYQI
jgi:hypothetical protein